MGTLVTGAILSMFVEISPKQALGLTLESAVQHTKDRDFSRQDFTTGLNQRYGLDEESYYTLTVDTSLTASWIKRLSEESGLVQLWDDQQFIRETGRKVSLSQDFGKVRGVAFSYGQSSSAIDHRSQWGLGLYQWFWDETIQVTFDYGRSFSRQNLIETVDRDAFRIITPESIAGETYSLGLLAMVSPVLMVEGGVVQLARTDRPDAQSMSAKGRYYIKSLESAAHLQVGHFRNLGEIRPVTLQGETTAYWVVGEWHQRLLKDLVLMGGYRWYLEDEIPRAANALETRRGSDSLYAKLTYRAWSGVWTHDASEYFGFYGNYLNSDALQSNAFGLGCKLLIN